jgi:hypothetical protein
VSGCGSKRRARREAGKRILGGGNEKTRVCLGALRGLGGAWRQSLLGTARSIAKDSKIPNSSNQTRTELAEYSKVYPQVL